MKKIKLRVIDVLKYILYFAAMYLLFRARIDALAPFAFAFFAALLYLKQNKYVCSVFYIGAGYLAALSFSSVIYFAVEAAVMLIAFLIHGALKKPVKILLLPIYMLAAKAAYLGWYMSGASAEVIITRIIETALSMVFAPAFINGLRALIVRGMRFSSTVDENVSLMLLLIAVYTGMYGADLFGFDLAECVAIAAVLIFANIFGSGGGAVIGAALGLGGLICDGTTVFVAVYTVFGLVAGIFAKTVKPLSAMAVLVSEVIMAYFFGLYGDYSYLNLLPVIAGALLFLCFPKNRMEFLAAVFGVDRGEELGRYTVNRSRMEMSRKLLQMSDVFREMEIIYERLIFGEDSEEDAVKTLANDLKAACCADCEYISKCYTGCSTEAAESFSSLIAAGICKGKVTLMELDKFLTGRCIKVNTVLQKANHLINIYRQNTLMRKNIDSGKALTARQMGAVSKVFKQLSDQQQQRAVYNERLEKQLLDELCANAIACSEIMVLGEKVGDMTVSLLIVKKHADSSQLSEIVSRVLNTKMMIVARDNGERKNFAVVTLKPVPHFDAVFGVASKRKFGSDASGDTHSLLKISEDKLMLCLCDGMGSGEMAEKISSAAVALVENFYLAGFESDVILNSVNKLLAYAGGDVFAAIDVAAIDLAHGICDFIKIGASESYLKRKNGVDEIAGSSLPLGILEEISPWSRSECLTAGDMIILLTDGVREAFGSGENVLAFLNEVPPLNPKEVAESIIDTAMHITDGRPPDDMTAVVCKIV